MPLSDLELTQRLLLAALFGALIGIEREVRHKAAGLRTNILIAVGSAMFTIVSIQIVGTSGADPGRIAAQIVTGIGFLGAGSIIRTEDKIHGLTTAATVWVNASLGVAAGTGDYHLAFIGALVTLGVLLLLYPVERVIERRTGGRDPLDRP
jgi:putative Mg2+ transporter-C (MgtC) family protein